MKLEQIDRIAVVGLGRMGHGIAQTFAMAGYCVYGFDESADARHTALDRIATNLDDLVDSGLLSKTEVAPILSRIEIAGVRSKAVAGSQFVVEAIAENLDAKRDYFAGVENEVADTAILASNSSSFTISKSGEKLQRPERAIVTHWFNPPHIVPTVEVVPGPLTAEEVTQTTLALHKKIGKLAVRINGEIPGFLVNRVQVAMIREVWDLYERGIATPEDIDAAIRGSLGFRLAAFGPLAICDFGGVNIWATVYEQLAPDLRADAALHESIQALLESRRFGAASGAGIHDYDPARIGELTSQRDEIMLKLARLLHKSTDESET